MLSGACAAHAALSADIHAAREKLRAEAMTIDGPDAIWTETITLATRPMIDTASLRNREDAIGRLVCALETIEPAQLGVVLKTYADKLLGHASWPRLETRQPRGCSGRRTERCPPELIERARDLLLARIAGGLNHAPDRPDAEQVWLFRRRADRL